MASFGSQSRWSACPTAQWLGGLRSQRKGKTMGAVQQRWVDVLNLHQKQTDPLGKLPRLIWAPFYFPDFRTDVSPSSSVEKAAGPWVRSSTQAVPGEIRTSWFFGPTIMKFGWSPSWHCWSLQYSLQWPADCQTSSLPSNPCGQQWIIRDTQGPAHLSELEARWLNQLK